MVEERKQRRGGRRLEVRHRIGSRHVLERGYLLELETERNANTLLLSFHWHVHMEVHGRLPDFTRSLGAGESDSRDHGASVFWIHGFG